MKPRPRTAPSSWCSAANTTRRSAAGSAEHQHRPGAHGFRAGAGDRRSSRHPASAARPGSVGRGAPAVAAAERYAALFGARLRALSVVEPLAVLPEVPQQDTTDHYRRWEETLARDVWPLIRAPGVETLVRYGTALETILREAAEWRADVVVVATHGKGPVTRMLVGSVTEGLINHLPTSLLVVPAGAGAAGGAALVEPDAAELITVKHEEET